jgi:hypothetical protein
MGPEKRRPKVDVVGAWYHLFEGLLNADPAGALA